jgi:hypothetical protein
MKGKWGPRTDRLRAGVRASGHDHPVVAALKKRLRRLLARYTWFGWAQWGFIFIGAVVIARDLGLVALALISGALVVLNVALYRPELLREGVFVLALVAFFASIIVVGDASAPREFYATTAQVVPALFIALAFQIQAFLRTTQPGEERRAPAITALALVVAEYECLNVVASGDAIHGSFGLVVGALAAAAVGLALPILLGAGPDTEPTS